MRDQKCRFYLQSSLVDHCPYLTAQDISPSNLMVRVGEYHVLNRNEAHPHLDRRIREAAPRTSGLLVSPSQQSDSLPTKKGLFTTEII
jgi:hypothetical protein